MSEPPELPDDDNISQRTRRIAVELMPIFYQDIRRMARKLLRTGGRSVLIVGPKPSPNLRKKLGATMLKK